MPLAACQTYDAVVTAPPEFWFGVENIFVAFVNDILELLKWL